jgi:hypothetical protein
MKRLITAFVVAAMCATGSAAFAQTSKSKPATTPKTEQTKKEDKSKTPATVTAVCKDGTTYTGKTRKGACAKHGGVKSWEKAKDKSPA